MKEPSDFPTTSIRHVGPGTRLNGIYEVEALIATGGMGEVYKGRAIETGIAVAIKVIRPDLAENETVLALFKKEAASLHNLLHDAVVRYYVFSTDPALRRPYLAMEYVEGQALSEVLVRGPLSADAVGILQRRIASALDVAHRSGVVHRDISPDNIILPGGDPARAKLIDFGIARSAVGGETVIGDRFAGKVNYASPEQIGLYGGGAGAKSDIYSLGLTLAAALSGTPLPMGGTQFEVVQKRQQVPNLDTVPASYRPLLTRMLQPNPDDRPDGLEVSGWYPAGREPRAATKPRGWAVPAFIAAAVIVSAGLGYFGSRYGTDTGGGRTNTAVLAPPTQTQPAAPAQPATAPVPGPAPARPGSDPAPSISLPAPEPSAPARLDVSPPPALRTTTEERPAAPVPPPAAVPAPEAVASPQPVVPAIQVGPSRTADGGLKDCSACPELIGVPAGQFRMGSAGDPTERPIHDVQIRAFMAGRYPVTGAEWRVCVREKGCTFDAGGEPDAPVHNISYDDAQQYVRWLGKVTGKRYRLLSEAEWEYAARAGTSTTYWWGDLFRSDRATCKTCSDPAPRTPPRVGRYPANAFGIYDVTGSVGQWVEDCWHKDYRGAPTDGSAWDAPQCRERVLRGGSWLGDAVALRIASRDFYEASVRYPGHGFRIARDM